MASIRRLRWLLVLGATGMIAALAPRGGVILLVAAQDAVAAAAAPEDASPEEDEERPTIRLQFEGTPYLEVVRRFAQMAGKPLVGDLSITGELTFIDSEPYTYAEALDTLNLILGMQGYLLQEKGRFLVLIRSEDVMRPPGSPQVYHGEAPASTRPGEVVTVTLPLEFLDAETVVTTFTPMVSKGFGRIAGLGRGKSVIITDTQDNIRRIRRLLDQIDTGTTIEQQLKTFVLKHASAKDVAEVLGSVMGIRTASRSGPTYRMVYSRELRRRVPVRVTEEKPATRTTVAHDERTNTIIIVGSSDKIGLARDLIGQLDVPGDLVSSDFRIFVLKHHRAEDVAEIIRESVPGKVTVRKDRRGRTVGRTTTENVGVIADPATNRVIVTAERDVMAKVERLIEQLDQPGEVAEGVKIFRLKNADPQQLAASLQGLLSKIDPRTRRPATDSARITADPRTGSLIVAGSAGEIRMAERLVAELDIVPEETAREIHVVTLKGGDARELAKALPRLWAEKRAARGRRGRTETVSSVRVEADPGSNSLIIASPPGEWEVVKGLLEKLQAAVAEDATPVTRQFKVEHAPVQELAKALNAVYGGGRRRGRTRGGPQRIPVVVAPAESSRTLLVTASEEDLTTIASLLEALDVPPTDAVEPVRIIELEAADAAQVAQTLQAMLPEPPRGQRPSVIVRADPTTNTVMLRGADEERQVLEELLARLDDPSREEARETRVIPLKLTSARELVSMLAPLYTGQNVRSSRTRRGRRRAQPVAVAAKGIVITPSPDDRALVVEGPKAAVEEIARLVASVDTGEDARPVEFRTYSLTGGTQAAELARSLGRLFSEREKREPSADPAPRFESDAGANQLLVAATDRQFAVLEDLIEESIKSGADLESRTKTYRLKYAVAETVAPVLEQMLVETPPDRRGRRRSPPTGDEVRVAALAATNSVVVQAPAEKIALADELIATFDDEQVGAGTQVIVEIVELQNAQAITLAEAVNAALAAEGAGPSRRRRGRRRSTPAASATQVAVTPEPNSNSVLVRGPADEVPEVVAMVKRLDAGGTEVGSTQVRVFSLENGEASSLERSVGRLFREIVKQQARNRRDVPPVPFSIAADVRTNSLIVSTTPSHFAVVEQLLKTLDQAPEAPGMEVEYFWLQNADAAGVAASLQELYASRKGSDKPVVEADAFGNAVTVIARAEDLIKDIRPLIAKLDEAAATSSFQVRVMPLTGVKAAEMARVLQSIYQQMTDSEVVVVDEGPARRPIEGSLLGPGGEPSPEPAEKGSPEGAAKPDDSGNGEAPSDPSKSNEGAMLKPRGDRPIAKAPEARSRAPSQWRPSIYCAPLEPQEAAAAAGAAETDGAPEEGAEDEPGQRVTISVDKRTNSLVVSGSRQDLDQLQMLLDELLLTIGPDEAEFRIFKIRQADPLAVAQTLDALFNPKPVRVQQQNKGKQVELPPLPPPVISVAADERTRSLIVRAKPLDFDIIEPLIKVLDQPSTSANEVRVFPLKNTDAEEVAANLNDLFQPTAKTTTPTPQKQSQKGKKQPAKKTPQARRTAAVQRVLEFRAAEGVTQVGGTAPVSITANKATNSVVVSAPPDVMVLVEGLIQELDQSIARTPAVRFYPLKHAEVAPTVESLREVFDEKARRRPGGAAETPVVITGNEAGRQVIVSATPNDQHLVSDVIAEIDRAEAGKESVVRVYKIEHAEAAEVAQAISGALAETRGRRGRTPAGAMRITSDRSAGNVVVRATTEEHERIARIIAEMDAPPGGEYPVRTIMLKNADPETVAGILGRVFGSGEGASRRRRGRARGAGSPAGTVIEADDRARMILVRADDATFEAVRALAMQIDANTVSAELAQTLISLEHAKAEAVAPSLAQAFAAERGRRVDPEERVTVVAEPYSNSLLITANAENLAKVRSLLEKLDTDQVAAGARTEFLILQHARATDLANVLSRVAGGTGGGRGRRRSRSQAVVVTADTSSNALVLSGPSGELDRLIQMARDLDRASQAGLPGVYVVPIEKGDAAAAAAMVRDLHNQEAQLARRDGRRIDPLAVSADAEANAIVLATSKEMYDRVSEWVGRVEEMKAGRGEHEIITLKHADPAEVERAIRAAFAGDAGAQRGRRGRRTPPGGATLEIAVLPKQRALVVSASPEDFALIRKLAETLDEEAVGTRGEVRTYALENAEVGPTVEAIQQLFAGSRGRRGRSRAPSTEVPVIVTGDEAARMVIVSAAPEQHDLVADLVREIDAAHAEGRVVVKVYRLKYAEARSLGWTLLNTMRRDPRGGTESLRITGDRSTSSVIVRGTPEQQERVAELIAEIDVRPTEEFPVHTIALANADPERLAGMLSRVFQASTPGRRRGWGQPKGKDLIIEANKEARTLMVRADEETFEKVKALAMKLDTESTSGEPKRTLLRLEFAQAQAVASSLAEAFTPPRGRRIDPEDTVSVVAEPFSNSLIVTANEENLEKVKSLLAKLDTEESGGAKTEFLILEHAQATELANVLSRVAMGTGAARGRRGSATGQEVVVSADAASNALVMSGPSQEIERLVAMARDLDGASAGSATDVYIIPLENGEAIEVASMVQDLYRQQERAARRERRRIGPLAVSADERANAVVLATNQAMYEQVSEWIGRVEIMTPSRGTMRVIRLQYADPSNVEKAILQLFGDQATSNTEGSSGGRSGRRPRGWRGPVGRPGPAGAVGEAGPTGQVETTVIPEQRSILIKASEEDFEEIMRLVALLEAEAEKAKREVRVFPLENALNTQVAQALNQLYQQMRRPDVPADEVTVTALANTRAVVVAASQEKMPEVEGLIEQLDTEEVAPQLEFRIYPLEHAQPTKILPALRQMLQQVQRQRPGEPINVQADERTRSIIITARGAVFDEVEKIVEALDTPPAYAEANVLVVQLRRADAPRLASVLQEMLRPDTGNQVTDEARALQEQVRRLKIRSAGDEEKLVELDLTKPVKISSDPETSGQQGMNALILSSTPDNLKALEAVVLAMDRVPLAEGAKLRIIHLRNADAESVVEVLEDVFAKGRALAGKPGSSVEGEAEPETVSGKALVNVLGASADPRTNTVLLSGVEETLALAELIVHDLDRSIGKIITEVRLFKLKHASAERLVPVLESVFGEGDAEPGTEGVRTHVTRLRTVLPDGARTTRVPKARPALTIQADPATNILIVAARSDLLPLIEDVVTTMDIPGAGTLGSVQIFPLQHSDATRLKGLLEGLYAGPNAALIRDADKPNVLVDTRTNALVIAGNRTTLSVIGTLLQRLDAPAKPEVRAIKIMPLENADAQALAPTLQKVMDARVQRLESLGEAEAEGLRAFILADPRSNSLIVGGAPEAYELAKSLAQQLDAAPPALAGQVRLFPLEKANAATLSRTLTSLFSERYEAARAPEIQRQRPIILPDLRTNSLLVAAGADDTRVLESLLKKLDVELVDPAVRLTVIPLKHNDAGVVGPMIEEIFAARLQSMTPPGTEPMPQERVDVAVDALANALVVSASKENLGLVRGLLEKVDVEPAMAKGIVRMYPLEFADAQRVATMLEGLLSDGLYKPGLLAARDNPLLQAREKVAFAVDLRTNVLIVSASPENFAVIESIVERIDAPDSYGLIGGIRLYPLKHAEATRLAPTLQQFFDAKRAAEEATGGGVGRLLAVSIIPDARTNTLLVAGGREAFAAVASMLNRLDAADVTAASEFRIFELESATAAALQPVLEELFAERPVREGEERPVTIIADPRANALVVGASPEDMRRAEAMIARLDRTPDRPGESTRVFVLEKADAAQVAATVTDLFEAEGVEGVGIGVDERTNAIVVSAGAADMKRVADLVNQLDTDALTQVTEIRILQLQNADAEELSELLTSSLTEKPESPTGTGASRQTLLQFVGRTEAGEELVASALQEGVVVTPDRRTNSLICLAPLETMPLLESLVRSLDSVSPRFAEIRVYTCRNADAQQMANLLGQLFRLENAAGDGRAVNYRLVSDAGDGARATLGNAEQYALTITVDVRTNSLLVGGTKHYADLVLGICRELDASPAQERMTRVYRLRNAQAPDVEATLRNFLDQERARLEAALGQEGLGAAQRLLEHEVAVVAEENTNALLLSASPRYFNTILDMIRELDTPPPQVLIQVLLAEVRLDDDVDLGIDWNLTGEFGSDDDKAFNVDTTFGPEALFGTTGFSVSVTGADFGFFLRALQTQGRLEVLSRPSILTADNQEGRITVGQRVPFITNSRVTEEGTTINTIQYENVAIELLVLPHINPDGTVRMEIQPQISSIAESTVEISEGVNAIIVDTREAATTLTVQDGHTVVIGGLITTDESSSENKVPFFGDLPVLGPLFKRTSKSQERRELLIILTPTVIRNATESDRTTDRELERLNELRSMNEGEARDFRPHDVLYPAPLRKRERPPIRDARMRKRGLLIEHEDADETNPEEAVRRETDPGAPELPPIPAPAGAEEAP